MDVKRIGASGQFIVFFIFGLMIYGLFYFAYFSGRYSEYKFLRNEREKLEEEIRLGERKRRDAKILKRDLENLDRELKQLKETLPEKKEISDILRNIQDLATISNLSITRFSPKGEISKGMYLEWPISISLIGSYHNFGYFLNNLFEFKKIFNMDNLIIGALSKQSDNMTVSISFDVTTYILSEPASSSKEKLKKELERKKEQKKEKIEEII
ncbi:MAG: type 4a pilus biogenesis protein PilO [Acidobacteriota bacterium]